MVMVLFVPRPEGDVKVFFVCRPLSNLSARISFTRRGDVAARGRPPDDDVDLFLNRPLWSGRWVSRGPTIGERRLVTNIATQMPVPDEVFNLTLQVRTFLRVVAMFPMETTIPSFVTSFRVCLHWIGSLQKPPLPNLKEDLCSSRVEGYWRRSG
ncbi:hypothetical protein BHM03_00025586 [Ensete ventricosum]|nr:hypothetical protein BHM03_00025586 [Ensete ventricosum]